MIANSLSAQSLREAIAGVSDGRRPERRGFTRAPSESLELPSIDNAFIDRCRLALGKLIGLDDEGLIGISSARRKEGRSTVAAALAITLSRTRGAGGVLLLDLDFERPTQANLFSVAPAPGLADFLEGRERLRVVSGGLGRQLSLLPAGQRLGDSGGLVHLLGREGMISVFRERFQWVVVDFPPILMNPEVAALTADCNWNILVGRHRRTTLADLCLVHEMIARPNRTGFLLTADTTRIPAWIRRLL